jgi:hypothetical protein
VALFKKSAQKFLPIAGAGIGSAVNRRQRRRLTALVAPRPAVHKNFLRAFF